MQETRSRGSRDNTFRTPYVVRRTPLSHPGRRLDDLRDIPPAPGDEAANLVFDFFRPRLLHVRQILFRPLHERVAELALIPTVAFDPARPCTDRVEIGLWIRVWMPLT